MHYGRCASGVCLVGFLKTLPPGRPSGETALFGPKTISKVAIIKTKSAKLSFSFLLLSSSLFLFLLFLLELVGLKKPAFSDAFLLKRLQISSGWFSKNQLDVHVLT